MASFKIKSENWPATLTYFIQEMLKYNILTTDKCYVNYKHDYASLKSYKKACFKVFKKISSIQKNGTIIEKLEGPIKEMGFNRLTKS